MSCAKQLKVMVHINEPKDFENKAEYEQKLIQLLHS
ncbi:phosphoribosylglycinamide formyltransferase, partial [Corynebacterium diphtheriae]